MYLVSLFRYALFSWYSVLSACGLVASWLPLWTGSRSSGQNNPWTPEIDLEARRNIP
jgi:hypothetical protein